MTTTQKRPPRPVGTVMLPNARLAQLHAIASLREPAITVPELIEEFINEEIEAGALPDQLPGFAIHALPRGSDFAPSFVIDDDLDFGFEYMRSEDALAIADVLDAVSRPGPDKGKAIGTDKQLKIIRVGRGVVIAGSKPEQRRNISYRMAADLARQLRHAVAQAKAMSVVLS